MPVRQDCMDQEDRELRLQEGKELHPLAGRGHHLLVGMELRLLVGKERPLLEGRELLGPEDKAQVLLEPEGMGHRLLGLACRARQGLEERVQVPGRSHPGHW